MRIIAALIFLQLHVGCLYQSDDTSKPKLTIGSENTKGFADCIKLLQFVGQTRPQGSNHIINNEYKHESSGMQLTLGLYEESQRFSMRNQPTFGSFFRMEEAGSYEATMKSLNKYGIYCEESGDDLTFIFPANKSESDYREVTFESGGLKRLILHIGTIDRQDQRLALTATMRKDGSDSYSYHAFDTDARGKIVKHVSVDEGGKKTTHLDE